MAPTIFRSHINASHHIYITSKSIRTDSQLLKQPSPSLNCVYPGTYRNAYTIEHALWKRSGQICIHVFSSGLEWMQPDLLVYISGGLGKSLSFSLSYCVLLNNKRPKFPLNVCTNKHIFLQNPNFLFCVEHFLTPTLEYQGRGIPSPEKQQEGTSLEGLPLTSWSQRPTGLWKAWS